MHRFEYSLFSQNGEDGLLRHLFAAIGFESRRFVEIGFTPVESNSLRLVLKEKFRGLYVDRDAHAVERFNDVAGAAGLGGVLAAGAFLDRENVNETLRGAGASGEVDLLSIDVDGNDYWLWEALETISARVVVIEYNAAFGPELSVTVPYEPRFDRHAKHASGFYCGASLAALDALGMRKGYALVACDSAGVNAFFVRRDCMTPSIEPLTARDAYRPHRRRLKRGFSTERQLATIRHLPFEAV